MLNQTFVPAGRVELVMKHMPDCACSLGDGVSVSVVQFGCISGYLVEQAPTDTRPSPHAGQGCPNCPEGHDCSTGDYYTGDVDLTADLSHRTTDQA